MQGYACCSVCIARPHSLSGSLCVFVGVCLGVPSICGSFFLYLFSSASVLHLTSTRRE